MSVTDKEINGVVGWIRTYLNSVVPDARYQAIVGLSGGIDSAVIASLCVKAVGPNRVLGIILPCESASIDRRLAFRLVANLGIYVSQLSLDEAFNRWRLDFQCCTDGRMSDLNKGNAKARFRMLSLYAFAAEYGGLVIGTTNKTEAVCGYATKYGDNAVDIEPIQEFYKTEIWEMAEALGNIPQEIVDRPPTAGLWEGQTDEAELGMSYAEIDKCLMDLNWSLDAAVGLRKRSPASDVLDQVLALYTKNKHKDFHLPCYHRNPVTEK